MDTATHTRDSILRLRDYVNQRILGQDHLVERMLVAPLGARFAHSLPVKPLKRGFGVFLALLALQMTWRLLH